MLLPIARGSKSVSDLFKLALNACCIMKEKFFEDDEQIWEFSCGLLGTFGYSWTWEVL